MLIELNGKKYRKAPRESEGFWDCDGCAFLGDPPCAETNAPRCTEPNESWIWKEVKDGEDM